MIVNKIEEFCVHLFLIDCLVSFYIFHTIILYFYSEFSYIKVWFSDQNSKPLEIEEQIRIILVIN